MCYFLCFLQHRYDEIVDWYKTLASDNSNVVKYVESIGKSVEGRDQPAVHITTANGNVNKIYFQCQIHASMQKVNSIAISVPGPASDNSIG